MQLRHDERNDTRFLWGILETLLGTVIPLLPPYLPVVVLICIFFRKFIFAAICLFFTFTISPSYATPREGASGSLELTKKFIQTFFTAPGSATRDPDLWTVSLYFIGVLSLLAFFFISHILESVDFIEGSLATGVFVLLLSVPIFLFLNIVYKVPFDFDHASEIARSPWVPAEELSLSDKETEYGYVLDTKDDWFVVLRESDRTIHYLKASDVESREVCKMPGIEKTRATPVITLKGADRVDMPECRDID